MIKYISLILFVIVLISSFSFAIEQKEKTEITGDKMTVKDKGTIAIFEGNAKVKKGNYNITSNEMIYYKDNSQIQATGQVNFITTNEDGSKITANSNKATYNTEKMSGKMWDGKPVVKYYMKASSEPIVLYMDELYLDDNFESAKAQDNVQIISSSGTITSDNAILNKKENSLYMKKDKNKPQVNVWQNDKKAEFKADEIELLYNNKTVKMKNNVEGTIIFDNLENVEVSK